MAAEVSSKRVRRTAVASVLLVALVAAICSFAHMQHLAQESGEEWRSWLVPLSVDGMLVAATLAIVDRRRVGRPAGWVPWTGLSLGVLASLAANIAAARSDPISRAIAAWPPIALALSVETLVIVLREPASDRVASPEPRGMAEPETPTSPETSLTTAPAPPETEPVSLAAGSDRKSAKTVEAMSDEDVRRKNREYQREYRARKRKAQTNGHAVLQDVR